MAYTPFAITKWEMVNSRSTITPFSLRPVAFFVPTIEFVDIAKNNNYFIKVIISGTSVYDTTLYGILYRSSTTGTYFLVIETTYISIPGTLGIITLAPYTNPSTTTINVTTATYGTANIGTLTTTNYTSGTLTSSSALTLSSLTASTPVGVNSSNNLNNNSFDVTTIETLTSGAMSTTISNTRITNYTQDLAFTLAAGTSGFTKRITFTNDWCTRTRITLPLGTIELSPSSCLDYELIYNVNSWYAVQPKLQNLITTFSITQNGTKMVGTGATGAAGQGRSLGITKSCDMYVVCGNGDNTNIGAFWTFTKSGGVWSQLGSKTVPTGYTGTPNFGLSSSLTPDGTRYAVGGYNNNTAVGALWIFSFASSTWTQEAGPLVGTGAVGAARQGISVAISADGATVVYGGDQDNGAIGAAWVWTRSGTTWTQQGGKLVGSGNTGASGQRYVAISGDGNTFCIGGPADNANRGAVWVFTRTAGVWTQQGSKLTDSTVSFQGAFIGLSADGNTLAVAATVIQSLKMWTRSGVTWTMIVSFDTSFNGTGFGDALSISADGSVIYLGATSDNANTGAVVLIIRRGNQWLQVGSKMIPSDALTSRVSFTAISANCNTVIFGGFNDNGGIGASWVYN